MVRLRCLPPSKHFGIYQSRLELILLRASSLLLACKLHCAFKQKISRYYYMLLILLVVSIACLAALVTQVILWRVQLPRNHFMMLLVIFVLFLLLGILVLGFAADWPYSLLFAQCFGLLALSYISFYSLIEGQSPSLSLVMAVHRKGAGGLSLVEVDELMSIEDVVGIRIRELERDNLIFTKNSTYRLTRKGMLLARLFGCGRRVLGIEKGG